jgi:hypothetical protein
LRDADRDDAHGFLGRKITNEIGKNNRSAIRANMRADARRLPLTAPITRATWPLKSYVGFHGHLALLCF